MCGANYGQNYTNPFKLFFSLLPITYPVNKLEAVSNFTQAAKTDLTLSWWLTNGNNLNNCIKKRQFDYFSVRSIFIPLMNTKTDIFIRGFAIREKTAFDVHLVK